MKCEADRFGKALQSVTQMVNTYVARGSYLLNPDEDVVKHIIRLLAENRVRYGLAYCPCKAVTGIRDKDRENICPCRAHREEITIRGTCECGLFVSRAYVETFRARKGSP